MDGDVAEGAQFIPGGVAGVEGAAVEDDDFHEENRRLVIRDEGETLSTDGGFEHEATDGFGEDDDAIFVVGIGRGAVFGGDGGGLCGEGEFIGFEAFEGALVLEEDGFAIFLSAELEAEGGLGEVAEADGGAFLVEDAAAVGAAEASAAFSDGGEDGVAVGGIHEASDARVSGAEAGDGGLGFGVEVGAGGVGCGCGVTTGEGRGGKQEQGGAS